MHVCEGKDASTIESFKSDLEKHKGSSENIDNFCCDMSPAFISGIENTFPNASITFDKFHVMKLMNDAIDKVRREEQSHNILLKKTRYLWLKNPENLSVMQNEAFRPLKDLRLKTLRAYNIKLALRDFWNQDPHSAGGYLKRWYFWATHSISAINLWMRHHRSVKSVPADRISEKDNCSSCDKREWGRGLILQAKNESYHSPSFWR